VSVLDEDLGTPEQAPEVYIYSVPGTRLQLHQKDCFTFSEGWCLEFSYLFGPPTADTKIFTGKVSPKEPDTITAGQEL
jgi:hypothetical protein